MFEFKIINQDPGSRARTGQLQTPHGAIHTPVFMPCGTLGTVKSLSPDELTTLGTEIILANTYHLYLRPGHELISKMGGLHAWTGWHKPMLTDSGGYQVFSLAGNKSDKRSGKNMIKILENGVEFRSHLDGSKHFLTPAKVMQIQHALGADIIMAFDECAPADSDHQYAKEAMERTHNWLKQCAQEHQKIQAGQMKKTKKTTTKAAHPQKPPQHAEKSPQALFPIIQGVIYDDLRVESVKFCAEMDLPGIAIGGLSVGEERATMYHLLETIHPYLPARKPRYLMGVGTPRDLLEGVERGIDMFDCVHITRMSRHSSFYDETGRQHLKNSCYKDDPKPLQPGCNCYSCSKFSRSYLRHLMMEQEMLGARLLTIHNLHFLLDLMGKIREHIGKGSFITFKKNFLKTFKATT